MTSERTIARLIVYRRLLNRMLGEGVRWAHSRELADLSGVQAAQVRRDLMGLGYTGTPARGYDVCALVRTLAERLDPPGIRRAALVGIGRMGAAILAYFQGRGSGVEIRAAFDSDPRKADRHLYGCACHGIGDLPRVVAEEQIRLGILAVPAGAAQPTADLLVASDIRGIVNFAPVPLRTPEHVFVEQVDITAILEKVAFFAANARVGGPLTRSTP